MACRGVESGGRASERISATFSSPPTLGRGSPCSTRLYTAAHSSSMLRIAATVARRAAAPAPRLAAQFARPSFAAPRLRSFASSAPRRDAEQPQPTDGEQQLHSKLLEKLPGAKVAVQDVSGPSSSPPAPSVNDRIQTTDPRTLPGVQADAAASTPSRSSTSPSRASP